MPTSARAKPQFTHRCAQSLAKRPQTVPPELDELQRQREATQPLPTIRLGQQHGALVTAPVMEAGVPCAMHTTMADSRTSSRQRPQLLSAEAALNFFDSVDRACRRSSDEWTTAPDAVPEAVKQGICERHLIITELLRLFWSAVRARKREGEEKLARLCDRLREWQQQLSRWATQVDSQFPGEHYSASASVLQLALQMALSHYARSTDTAPNG